MCRNSLLVCYYSCVLIFKKMIVKNYYKLNKQKKK